MDKDQKSTKKLAVLFLISFVIGIGLTFINRSLEIAPLLFSLAASPVSFGLSYGVSKLLKVDTVLEGKPKDDGSFKESKGAIIAALFAAIITFIFGLINNS